MPRRQLIGPPPRSTPPGPATSRDGERALPADLLQEASRRLGVLSLLGAVLWVVGVALAHLAVAVTNPAGGWNRLYTNDAIGFTAALLSFALYLYTRRRDRDPALALELGRVYMVLTSLALALTLHWNVRMAGEVVRPEITWVGAVILMAAAFVPTTPRKTLAAGLVAASMNPISMLVARARGGWDFGPPVNALVMHYPDFILVGVAVVISRVVARLGAQVTQARELGSYQLGELLGRGGMGEVYTATHRMLARPAAIKLIRPEVLGAGDGEAAQLAAARFRREAEAAASLRSPHTVEIYDFGVTEDRTLYFVMELLDGMDLETLVRTHGPVPARRAIHILRQVCESLEEAHARGLVHRDIKPANIHVGRLGLRHDFVKVLDFGLVKTVAVAERQQTLATDAGMTPGTPAYMAPELALGEAVDGRADLYAVGCVAFYLLTGRLVFEADTGLQMIARHLQAAPAAPSTRAPLPIPPALDELVLACLAKSPAERPRSAAALERSLAALGTEPWGEEEARTWWASHGRESGVKQTLR
jgi:serine/threonine-protein kinase